ncbi:MAG TPA: hypothetical protein VLE69_01565 [Candidatus Saccharimonadales bacterium]|nr:hypothetical protein [Candidatus Saccharimonadales bacterium]
MTESLNGNTTGGLHVGFMVDGEGICTELVASHEMSAAYDILTDAGYSPEKSADVIATAERHGINSEKIASKMSHLTRVLGD